MKVIEQCTEYNEVRKICIASEKGKEYRLENNSGYEVQKVKVDKCFPQEFGEKRCDYLMIIAAHEIKRAIFIELKGGALTDAVKQLCATIIYLKSELNGFQIDARIVGSRDVPGFINTPNYLKLAKVVLPKGSIERSTNKVYLERI